MEFIYIFVTVVIGGVVTLAVQRVYRAYYPAQVRPASSAHTPDNSSTSESESVKQPAPAPAARSQETAAPSASRSSPITIGAELPAESEIKKPIPIPAQPNTEVPRTFSPTFGQRTLSPGRAPRTSSAFTTLARSVSKAVIQKVRKAAGRKEETEKLYDACRATTTIVSKNLKVEGLFRITGGSNEIAESYLTLKRKGSLPETTDPHLAISTLKKALELNLGKDESTGELKVDFLGEVLWESLNKSEMSLPMLFKFHVQTLVDQGNYQQAYILYTMLHLPYQVQSHAAENKMNASNLAVTFAPQFMIMMGQNGLKESEFIRVRLKEVFESDVFALSFEEAFNVQFAGKKGMRVS